jgi:hypothetical protein
MSELRTDPRPMLCTIAAALALAGCGRGPQGNGPLPAVPVRRRGAEGEQPVISGVVTPL